MPEYVYYSDGNLDFPLPENIIITSEISPKTNNDFIVSNSKNVHAEIIADEIDFYINNSKDSIANKIKNVAKLYEINATRFDLAKDIKYSQQISQEVLLISTNEEKIEFLKTMNPDEFNLFHVTPEIVKSISGHIGELTVIVNNTDKDVTLNVSQIVWYNQSIHTCYFSAISRKVYRVFTKYFNSSIP